MPQVSDKTMFEIYREAGYGRRYRVVYFTELGDGNKEFEISQAMAGDHVYDGFIRDRAARKAKQVIARIVDRLNAREDVTAAEMDALLAPFVPRE